MNYKTIIKGLDGRVITKVVTASELAPMFTFEEKHYKIISTRDDIHANGITRIVKAAEVDYVDEILNMLKDSATTLAFDAKICLSYLDKMGTTSDKEQPTHDVKDSISYARGEYRGLMTGKNKINSIIKAWKGND